MSEHEPKARGSSVSITVRFPRAAGWSLAAWFAVALAVSASGALSALPRPALQGIILALTAGLLVICRAWRPLRAWAMLGDVRGLVGPHLSRLVAGLAFVWFYREGQLPWGFAVPGGIGDSLVALLAIGACLRPRRAVLLAWNIAGFIDIVSVVATAARFGLSQPESMAPLARLPLSVLPTFLVPLIIATHVLLFVRLARRGPSPACVETTPGSRRSRGPV